MEWKDLGYGNQTPLMIASGRNRLAVVRYLLSRNVELNAVKSNNGYSALHCAAGRGHTEVAVALLEAGIDHTSVTDKWDGGWTAQQKAERNNKPETAAAIASFIAEYARSPFHVLCSQPPHMQTKTALFLPPFSLHSQAEGAVEDV